ncbi:MAG: hypothetical protein ACFWT7_01100 [Succiniclasticum sp.]|jgi:hypothetical protein
MADDKKAIRVNFMFDRNAYEDFKLLAGLQGSSVSGLLTSMINEYLDKNRDILAQQKQLAEKLQHI